MGGVGDEGSGGIEGLGVGKGEVDGAGTSAILPGADSRLQLVSGITIRKTKANIIDKTLGMAASLIGPRKLRSFQLKRFL